MNKNTNIKVCGQSFDTGTRVVLWDEEEGLSFYAAGKGYMPRNKDLESLSQNINALYFHHTATFRAHSTFAGLKSRGLSCTFLVDDDINPDTGCATIYQCVDVKEICYTQGKGFNDNGSGIEICYYPDAWAKRYTAFNRKRFGVPNHPVVSETIHGHHFKSVHTPTEAQTKAVIRLAFAYWKAFPHIKLEFPKNEDGSYIRGLVSKESANGLLSHYNVKRSKVDPTGLDHQKIEKALQEIVEPGGDIYYVLDKLFSRK